MSWVPFGMEEGNRRFLVDGDSGLYEESLVDWMMQAGIAFMLWWYFDIR